MKPAFWLVPIAALVVYAGGVLFWAAFSHLRYLTFHWSEGKQPPPLGFWGWIKFYLHTLDGAFRLLWWFFRAAFQAGLRRPTGPTTGRPVLCVHGLFLNSTCMWGIRRSLERQGRPTRAVFMGAPFPTPLAYAGPLSRIMQRLAREFPDEGFDVVAHSIGGVMVRQVLSEQPELGDMVSQIVTLGSPHHGTAVLRWMRFGPIYRILSRDSEYLKALGDFRVLAPGARVTTVAALHDLVVYPSETAHLVGARQITLGGVSHLGLMTEARVLQIVQEALNDAQL